MGLDMWLPSVFDYNDGDAAERIFNNSPQVQAAQAAETNPSIDRRTALMALSDAMFDALRATGGYYREGYNRFGLFSVLGMSWHSIIEQLDEKTILPVDHARFLLAELEARPVTLDMIKRRALGDNDGMPPMAQWLEKNMPGCDHEPWPDDARLDAECERALPSFVRRREELMSLLRLAIERNEALRISG